MSTGKGYNSKAAFKIETSSTFGNSVPVNGASEYNMLHLISESISPGFTYEKSAALDGNAGAKTLYPVLKKYAGDLVLEGWYRGLESILAVTLGASHQDNSPIDRGDGAYEHYFELSDDLATRDFNEFEMSTPSGKAIRRGTLCLEKEVSIWEFASSMFNSVSMQITPERVTLTFNVIPKTLGFDTANNNLSTNWALPANGTQLLLSDMSVYLKARDIFYIQSSHDAVVFHESTDVSLDITDGSYTGYELAQAIQNAANTNATLTGNYICSYNEEKRAFTFKSDVSFYIAGTGDMNTILGFPLSNTDAGMVQSSTYFARPYTGFAPMGTSDKIGVNSVNWSLENNLDTESQDSQSDSEIVEPERNGMRNITGSLELPRYENDDLVKSLNGFTTYGLYISFRGDLIGGSNYEEFKIFFPQIKFTNVAAPVSGAELIKQTLNFEAQMPLHFLDMFNFLHPEYTIKDLPALTTDTVQSAGVYSDGLYVGGSSTGAANIWKLSDGAWSSSCDTGYNNVWALQMYDGKLFAGLDSGIILEMDSNNTWSSSCDVGAGDVVDFAVYDDKLFALEKNTGKIFSYNGSAWSLSCDTVATSAFRLQTYNGNLYMMGADTNGKVWEYDGSAWSLSCDMAAGTINAMGAEVYNHRLFVSTVKSGLGKLMVFDGTTWSEVNSLDDIAEIKHIVSYRGDLLLFPYGSSQNLYQWNFYGESETIIYASYGKTFAQKPLKFQDKLIIPESTTTPDVLDSVKEMLITIQNENSTNPL